MPVLTVRVSNPKLKTYDKLGIITCSVDEKALLVAAIQCDWYPEKTVKVSIVGSSTNTYLTKNLELA